MRHTTDTLRRETQSLSTALRKPQVRGRWGEMHLRRAVELAGLVDRCDFTEQAQLDGGALRPDLVVRLAGDKCVVVDAKVPLDAFLDATGTDDDDVRADHLERHARQLRTHVDAALREALLARAARSPPSSWCCSCPARRSCRRRCEADRGLLEHAAPRRVILATPTTLIALLRTVAHGWSHEALADQAREIHRLGRELHERLARMSSHLDQVGRSLNATVGHYNQAVGSLESRVLVSARKFAEMGVTDDELPAPRQVESTSRSVGTPDGVRTELHAADPPAETEDDCSSTSTRRGRFVRFGASHPGRLTRRLRWCRDAGAHPVGRGHRAGPAGRRARGRRHAHRDRARPAAELPAHRDLRHPLRRPLRGPGAAGPAPGLLHRGRAAAAADARRLRAARLVRHRHGRPQLRRAGQAVVTGLARHSTALVVGYGLCLALPGASGTR